MDVWNSQGSEHTFDVGKAVSRTVGSVSIKLKIVHTKLERTRLKTSRRMEVSTAIKGMNASKGNAKMCVNFTNVILSRSQWNICLSPRPKFRPC